MKIVKFEEKFYSGKSALVFEISNNGIFAELAEFSHVDKNGNNNYKWENKKTAKLSISEICHFYDALKAFLEAPEKYNEYSFKLTNSEKYKNTQFIHKTSKIGLCRVGWKIYNNQLSFIISNMGGEFSYTVQKIDQIRLKYCLKFMINYSFSKFSFVSYTSNSSSDDSFEIADDSPGVKNNEAGEEKPAIISNAVPESNKTDKVLTEKINQVKSEATLKKPEKVDIAKHPLYNDLVKSWQNMYSIFAFMRSKEELKKSDPNYFEQLQKQNIFESRERTIFESHMQKIQEEQVYKDAFDVFTNTLTAKDGGFELLEKYRYIFNNYYNRALSAPNLEKRPGQYKSDADKEAAVIEASPIKTTPPTKEELEKESIQEITARQRKEAFQQFGKEIWQCKIAAEISEVVKKCKFSYDPDFKKLANAHRKYLKKIDELSKFFWQFSKQSELVAAFNKIDEIIEYSDSVKRVISNDKAIIALFEKRFEQLPADS